MPRWYAGLGLMCVTALTACGGGADPTPAQQDQPPVVAVATTTQLGSVTSQITTCAGGRTETVMGPGDDPHDFSASPAQVAAMAKAKLVVANGLGLEQGLQRAIQNATSDGATVFEVAPEVGPIPFGDSAEHAHEGEAGHEGHNHGSQDPHFWLDVAKTADGATKIGERLSQQTQDPKYAECGRQVGDELKQVDQQVRDTLKVVPPQRRVLITDHEAFGYFAKAYDFRFAGAVVPGGSTDAEPSSQELAQLAEKVRAERVPAVFSNTAVQTKMVDALAQEAGSDVKVVQVYVGSLGPQGSGADTYQTMMTTNAQRIAEALK